MAIKKYALVGVVGMALAALGPAVTAQGQAMAVDQAKVLEQRQALMKAVGGNMKALSAVAKGESTEAPEEVARRAREINEAAKRIAALFEPEVHIGNVDGGLKTTANERIWQEPEKFAESAAQLEQASLQLAMAAEAGDNAKIRAAIGDLGKSCGGCHQLYRVKKN